MKTSMRNLLLNLAAIGLLALFLVWAETNLDGYKVQILNLIAVNAILALSLNLIYGFTGMFSLGHAGFMAIGAYVSALCVLPAAQKEMMWILEDIIWPFSVIHTPFWFSVVAGGFVAAIFGLFIAIPVLRLGGDYLGIATLGFAEIIRVLIVNLTPITNGSLGIKGIPFHASLLVNYGWLLITLYCMVKLLGSNFGNIFKAIRDDEIAAKVMGIDTFRTKVLSFCLGAFFAGVGGALLGNLLTTIDPKMFTFLLTFNVLHDRRGRRPRLPHGQHPRQRGHHRPARMAARRGRPHHPRRIRNPRHPRHAHGRVLAGPPVHHPVPTRGHHGNA